MNKQLEIRKFNSEVVHFHRDARGGYYDENGNRVTVEFLMRHTYEINGDHGYYIKECE